MEGWLRGVGWLPVAAGQGRNGPPLTGPVISRVGTKVRREGHGLISCGKIDLRELARLFAPSPASPAAQICPGRGPA
eukprot:scaffold7714_cov390-Prasinococcus_capsulatus_cf.AAC.4